MLSFFQSLIKMISMVRNKLASIGQYYNIPTLTALYPIKLYYTMITRTRKYFYA